MTREQRLTLAACILASATVFVDQTVVNVALPSIRRDLGGGLTGQQWVVEAYLLMLGSLVLVGGSLGDVLGRRRVFGVGVAGFGASSLLCAAAPSIGVLIAARVLQGCFGALLVPSSLAIITATFEGEARGTAIGSWTAWTSAAIACGPPLGGALVDLVSWRLVFAINVPLVLACLWLIATAVPELGPDPTRPGARVDVAGGVLCALGLGGVVYALIERHVVPGVAGAVALAAFGVWERRTAQPMLPPGIFASRNFAVGNIATFAIYAGLGSATFFVSLFLQQVAGYSALEGGASLLPISLAIVLLSRRWGKLAGRAGPRTLMTSGPLVAACGLALLLCVDAHAGYVSQVLPAVTVFGLGMSMTVAPLTATVLAAADRAYAGVASGVNNAIARIAGLLAIAGVGAIVAARLGSDGPGQGFRSADPASSVHALHGGMLASALLVAAGGLISLAGIRNPPRNA